jgi:rubrerythrin
MKEILKQLKSILNEDLGERNVLCDELFIRELLADEENAIRKYKDFAAKTVDPETTKLFLDIAAEEEVHKGELEYYLEVVCQKHGRTSVKNSIKGAREVQNLLSEGSDKIHSNNKKI